MTQTRITVQINIQPGSGVTRRLPDSKGSVQLCLPLVDNILNCLRDCSEGDKQAELMGFDCVTCDADLLLSISATCQTHWVLMDMHEIILVQILFSQVLHLYNSRNSIYKFLQLLL